MLRLNLPTEPYWVDLPAVGVRIKVRPLDSALYFAARSRAIRRAQEIQREAADLVEAGVTVGPLPDVNDPDAWSGYLEYMIAQAYGEMAIVDWEGVGDADGNPLPYSRETAGALMRVHQVAEQFISQYTAPYVQLGAEKNASGPALSGTSAAGAPTANAVATVTAPAAAAGPAPTGTGARTSSTNRKR